MNLSWLGGIGRYTRSLDSKCAPVNAPQIQLADDNVRNIGVQVLTKCVALHSIRGLHDACEASLLSESVQKRWRLQARVLDSSAQLQCIVLLNSCMAGCCTVLCEDDLLHRDKPGKISFTFTFHKTVNFNAVKMGTAIRLSTLIQYSVYKATQSKHYREAA